MKGERSTDILIIGGGLGGVAAAISALRLGKKVIFQQLAFSDPTRCLDSNSNGKPVTGLQKYRNDTYY